MDLGKEPRGWNRYEVEMDGLTIRREGDTSDANQTPVSTKTLYEEHAKTKEPCWGCVHDFRKPTQRGENKTMDDFWDSYERNADSLSPPQLYKLLASEFVRLIYTPSVEAGIPCMTWSVESIERHFTGGHILDQRADIRNTIHVLSTFSRVLVNTVVTESDTEPGRRVNEKRLKLYLELEEKKQKLFTALRDSAT